MGALLVVLALVAVSATRQPRGGCQDGAPLAQVQGCADHVVIVASRPGGASSKDRDQVAPGWLR